MCSRKLTFTALAVSSVNGGTIPDITRKSERPNTKQVERTIDLFAPRRTIVTCFSHEGETYQHRGEKENFEK